MGGSFLASSTVPAGNGRGIINPRNRAFDINQVESRVDADNRKVLNRDTFISHSTWHFFTWPNSARVLDMSVRKCMKDECLKIYLMLTSSTRGTMGNGDTMTSRQPVETPALHTALKSFTNTADK